ncbi:uncharacterized protein BJX67DRAFT_200420 [Aspergillus lucknowensis]|uniref:Secreted protein n=1 Tax=Aspergillus lucknowensis TaxID=176173 RepID=A0ABR4LJZ1_9EURO
MLPREHSAWVVVTISCSLTTCRLVFRTDNITRLSSILVTQSQTPLLIIKERIDYTFNSTAR